MQSEELQAALGEALTTKGELEEKVDILTTALKDAQKEERALRQNQSELKRQVRWTPVYCPKYLGTSLICSVPPLCQVI